MNVRGMPLIISVYDCYIVTVMGDHHFLTYRVAFCGTACICVVLTWLGTYDGTTGVLSGTLDATNRVLARNMF